MFDTIEKTKNYLQTREEGAHIGTKQKVVEEPKAEKIDSEEIERIKELMEAITTRADEYDLSEEKREETLKQAFKDMQSIRKELRANDRHSISAPEIGIDSRLIAIRHKNDIRFYINPIIIKEDGIFFPLQEDTRIEGKYIHARATQIEIAYTDIKGQAKETGLMGLAAAEFQKQCDALDGIPVSENGKRCDKWHKKTDDEKAEFLNGYLKDLDARMKAHEKVCEENAEVKEMLEIDKENRERLRAEIDKELKESNKGKVVRDLQRRKEKQEKQKHKLPWGTYI